MEQMYLFPSANGGTPVTVVRRSPLKPPNHGRRTTATMTERRRIDPRGMTLAQSSKEAQHCPAVPTAAASPDRPSARSALPTMLQPPGSGRRLGGSGGRGGGPRGGGRGPSESPDDQVRQLQRLPPNKRCADCSSKLPSCVNLTVGSFVCITCAGIHRELNQRVKGVGHSSFTQEEVDFLKSVGDNDRVNAAYLARYNPSSERFKEPRDNTDPQHLKNWIHRKYKDRAWHQGGGGSGGVPPSQQQRQTLQPTVAQLPPKPAEPVVDLFGGFDGSGGASAPPAAAPATSSWDAFGGGGAGQQSRAPPQPQGAPFQADFGQFSPPQQQQQRPSNAPHEFPADFGSSQTKQQFQQQAPPTPQQQHPPQQHQQFQHQQAPFQANFASFSPQQAQSQAPFQANFGQFDDSSAQPMPQQQVPPNTGQGGTGFANFGGGPPGQQIQQQPHALSQQQQQNLQQPPQAAGAGATGPTPGGFASFPMPQQPGFQPNPQMMMAMMGGGPSVVGNQAFAGVASGPPPLPTSPQAQPAGHPSQVPQQQQPSVSAAADAISNMTVSELSAKEQPAPKGKDDREATYKAGQRVYYKSSSYSGAAEVLKVHLDDDLVPYYTVRVNGKEKQTDDSHLSATHPLQLDIEQLLPTLSVEQLQHVKALVAQLANASSSSLQKSAGSGGTAPALSPSAPSQSNAAAPAPVAQGQALPTTGMPAPHQPQPQYPGMMSPSSGSTMPTSATMSGGPPQGIMAAAQQPQQPPPQAMPPPPSHTQQQPQQSLQQRSMSQKGQGMNAPSGQMPHPTQYHSGPAPSQQQPVHAHGSAPPYGVGSMMSIGGGGSGGFSGIPSPTSPSPSPAVPSGAMSSNVPPPPLVQGSASAAPMHPPSLPQQQQQPPPSTPIQGYYPNQALQQSQPPQQSHPPPPQQQQQQQQQQQFHHQQQQQHQQQYQQQYHYPPQQGLQGPPPTTNPASAQPPTTTKQSQVASNGGAPLSPKGNPFDFY